MIIDRLTENLDYIAALGDRPVNDGFGADALKAEFDRAGNTLKNYVNGVAAAVAEMLTGSVVFAPVCPQNDAVAANGASLAKDGYPALYAKIGGTFGETETTFALPDVPSPAFGVTAWILTGVENDG